MCSSPFRDRGSEQGRGSAGAKPQLKPVLYLDLTTQELWALWKHSAVHLEEDQALLYPTQGCWV